jgi:hypothetical protein
LERLTWGSYIKLYLKRIKDQLEAEKKDDRVYTFKAGATQLAKHLMSMYESLTLYQGRSCDALASYAYCYLKEKGGTMQPYFLFFTDGLTTDEVLVRKSQDNEIQP